MNSSECSSAGVVRLRIDLGYDGTEFSGWARQPGRRTVQGELEAALATVLRLPESPLVTVAGRTDAGVHARGQVAHVDVPTSSIMQVGAASAANGRTVPHEHKGAGRAGGGDGPERLGRALNGVLPPDVRIRGVRPAPAGFDARFSALSRRYSYRVADGYLDPLRRNDTLPHPRPLNVDPMNAASAALLGEHDFAAFCRRREGATTVRGLLAFSWMRDGCGVVLASVEADAFCHSMVRALVGALLAVGEGRQDVGWPASVLAAGVRDPAVTVVPAHGLTLDEVRYPDDGELADRAVVTRRRRTG